MYIFFFIPNTRFWKDKHGNCWRTIQRQRCVFLYFGNNTTGSRISCKPDSVLHACTNSLLNCNPFFSAAFLKSFLIRMPCYSTLILCYLIKCDPSFVHYLQKKWRYMENNNNSYNICTSRSGISLWAFNSLSHSFFMLTREISGWTQEGKFHTSKQPCII